MKKFMVLLLVVLVLLPTYVFAQTEFWPYGQNKVMWKKSIVDGFYQSEHFDVWHSLDVSDENQKAILTATVFDLETAYQQMSNFFGYDIKTKIPIVNYNSSWEFRNTNIVYDLIPRGVSAFVESERKRMVINESFPKPFKRRIIMHEMAHEFQHELISRNVPLGFIEGGAEFIAAKFSPDTRGDVRSYQKIDASNPELFLPKWNQFMSDQAHPYLQWVMLFRFLDETYGVGDEFIKRGLKETNKNFGEILEELTSGKLKNPDKYPENFDQLHRDFWGKKYALVSLQSPRPYEETKSLRSQSVTPREIPYPVFSASVSPDGKKISGFSYAKNGPSLILFDLDFSDEKKGRKVTNLTPNFPPKPFEYPISQGGYFSQSGSDLGWFQNNAKKSIAFFAQDGRDHKLFIVNSDNKNDLTKIDIPHDEAISPIFSSDGKNIYFSASYNVQRDIYQLDLETKNFKNLTNDSNFDTAPAISHDGKLLVYVALDNDFQKLFLLNTETLEKKQLTFNRFNDDSPSFSADGRTIIYTSDERNGFWNICTIDIYTNETKHWSEFFGGVFTPQFSPIDQEKIYFTAFWQYDQFLNTIYQNFEVYEAVFKNPLHSYVMKNNGENMVYAWRYFNLFSNVLDENQIKKPINPPKKWLLAGGEVSGGMSNYWGGFGYGSFRISDIKENNIYGARFVFSGNYIGNSLRLIDFSFLNREKRLNWGYSFYDHKLPLQYLHWDFQKGNPNQLVLNLTLANETGVNIFGQYPLSKFTRLEAGFGLTKRNFDIFIDDEFISEVPEFFTDTDRQFFSFFKKSNGFNASFSGSYVRDTVIFSNLTQGPIHGNALRVNLELAPPLGFQKSGGYASFSWDLRKYKRISDSSLLAFRFAGLQSSRSTGDYLLLGGDSTLRAYPYGYVAGNQVAYGSAEIRFPFVVVVAPFIGLVIPTRGFLFVDYAYAKFSGEKFPKQEGASLGPGISFAGFNVVWALRKIDGFKGYKRDVYISRGWNF